MSASHHTEVVEGRRDRADGRNVTSGESHRAIRGNLAREAAPSFGLARERRMDLAESLDRHRHRVAWGNPARLDDAPKEHELTRAKPEPEAGPEVREPRQGLERVPHDGPALSPPCLHAVEPRHTR